ncbi:NAD(P)-binding protein [Fistulina hepatica ATCC 64428]|uniref:NAD(P)-binding protein n=1 Tax=Fistulina hepatica ATCC 64428 TaxID=1128425 RepID=A0A0D7AHC8_9AGAR|nr:NAD(P)-binding protein [Fistulina hepatica ATCC 64428]
MSYDPSGQVVVITGCSEGGIGFALCEAFAARGCSVYATSRRLETMRNFTSPRIFARELDVCNDENIRTVITDIVKIEGRIDIFVNNAGSMRVGPLIDVPLEEVLAIFEVNIFAALRTARLIVPIMARQKRGLIVNVGSATGDLPTPWNGIYSASKAALHNLTEVLHMECKPFNIAVMLVTPGGVRSNISTNAAKTHDKLSSESLYTAFTPNIIKRLTASQNMDPMPAEEFAEKVADKCLDRNPPLRLLIGASAWVFRIWSWLPRWWAFEYFWNMYSEGVRTEC